MSTTPGQPEVATPAAGAAVLAAELVVLATPLALICGWGASAGAAPWLLLVAAEPQTLELKTTRSGLSRLWG